MLKCACVFGRWRCRAHKPSRKEGHVGGTGGVALRRTPRGEMHGRVSSPQKECRCGSACNARVRPSSTGGQSELLKPPPSDIFMWVVSRTPEGLLTVGGEGWGGLLSSSLEGESGTSEDDHRRDGESRLTTSTCVVLAETSQLQRLLSASSAWSQVTAVLFTLTKTRERRAGRGRTGG